MSSALDGYSSKKKTLKFSEELSNSRLIQASTLLVKKLFRKAFKY